MLALPFLLFLPAQIEIVHSADFSRTLQMNAVTATVHIVNGTEKSEGSGVVIGKKGDFVYILTARHIVHNADNLKVATYATGTYPKPNRVYDSATVVGVSKPIQDLALIRLAAKNPLLKSLSVCPPKLDEERKSFQAVSVGCGGGAAPTCILDEVLGKRKVQRAQQEGTAYFWEVDRKQVMGRSGGPLVDARGYLIGICSGTNNDKSYFCHAHEIRSFLALYGFE
jgi:hypothetical protein